MAQPTVAEVSWFVDLPDSRAVNVLHYNKTGTAWAAGDAAALRVPLQGALLLDWPGCITVSCMIIRCIVQIVNATFEDVSDSGPLATPGTLSAPTFPSATCAVLKKSTAEPGRSGRGRMFIGGLSETQHTDSYFASAAGGWPLLIAELGNSHVVGPDTFNPVVWSRKTEALHDITAFVPNPVLGHVRTRRPAAF